MISQSDYMKKKRMITVLKEQTKFSSILDSSLYTLCIEYGIEKKITNNTNDNCPDFITCNKTNQRINRKQHIKQMTQYQPGYVKDPYLKYNCCKTV